MASRARIWIGREQYRAVRDQAIRSGLTMREMVDAVLTPELLARAARGLDAEASREARRERSLAAWREAWHSRDRRRPKRLLPALPGASEGRE